MYIYILCLSENSLKRERQRKISMRFEVKKQTHERLMRERSVAGARLCQGYATRWVLAGTRNNICSSFHRDVRDTRRRHICGPSSAGSFYVASCARARSTKSEFHRRTSNEAGILFVQRCGFYRRKTRQRVTRDEKQPR